MKTIKSALYVTANSPKRNLNKGLIRKRHLAHHLTFSKTAELS